MANDYQQIIVLKEGIPAYWEQFLEMENQFLSEIGEKSMELSGEERLRQAVQTEKITFFLVLSDDRAIGMCSVARYWSTFSCGEVGVFEDFYVEPAFRKKGIARALAQTAQNWCRGRGVNSLTVCCAPCDEEMYRALGFDISLGCTYANLM